NLAVNAVVAAPDGKVYVGGAFNSYNNTPNVLSIVRLNVDGSIDSSFTHNPGCNNTVSAMALARDGSGKLYVGGSFTNCNGANVGRIARLNDDGSVDTTFDSEVGF